MKKFYSCVDNLIPSPLSEQHIIIFNKAKKEKGKITAYASEEVRTAASQPWIYYKLKDTPGLDGVIFFTALQFLYNEEFNYKLFSKILDEKYEIHFAREDMSFKKNNIDINDLNFLISYSLTHHRDDNSLIDLI